MEFWVLDSVIAHYARILGCKADSFPFTYLGILVSPKMALKRNWQPIVDHV